VQGPDLSIMPYDVSWNGRALQVRVRNLGLAPSSEGQLVCRTGLPNDYLRYDTPEQRWTQVGAVRIPPLMPNGTDGNQALLSLEWGGRKLEPGFWPVQCAVKADGDHYAPNDQAERVFRQASGDSR
jgi:hypothetical protein